MLGGMKNPTITSQVGGSQACDHCRKHRIKCDGEDPCARCANLQLECNRFQRASKPFPLPTPTVPKTSQTHYTISEDAIATTARNRLFAIESKSDLPQITPVTKTFTHGSVIESLTDDSSDDGEGRGPPTLPRGSPIPVARNEDITPVDIFETQRKVARENQRQSSTYFHKSSPKLDRDQMGASINILPSQTVSLARGTEGTEGTEDRTINQHASFEGSFTEVSITSATSCDADIVRQMRRRIQELEAENLEYHRRESQRNCPTNIQIFHSLLHDEHEVVYLSEPDWEIQGDDVILRGRFPVLDPRGYVERKGNIAFIVYKRYEVEHQRADLDEAIYNMQHLPKPEPASEEIELISDEMVKAVKAFFGLYPTFRTEFPEVDETKSLVAPYIWWYHCRKSPVIQNLPSQQTELVTALTSWIEDSYASLYDQVDGQFRRGRVSKMSMEYLIRPGRVLVSTKNGVPRGYVAASRPLLTQPDETPLGDNEEHGAMSQCPWSIKSRSIAYEGDFYCSFEQLTVKLNSDAEDDEVEIASLDVLPLEYASSAVRKMLRRRGETFWKCRKKYFVSYEGTCTDGKQEVCDISHLGLSPASSTGLVYPSY
ncbi:hypothetical protein F4818DRAFT_123908 [Hypoxylon cercidicola]|nr:hypothetical protein F4818DRAFT_123908 [Hypoxylon cercidicola]